jgi:hypothetical protein
MTQAPYLLHLRSSKDLETTYEAVRAGFVSLALEKNRRATPYVEEARALKVAASTATAPTDLLRIPDIQTALLTAAGISDKAATHLLPEDKTDAIKGLIRNFLEPAGGKFVEELVFRFLLTRGDTLGGSMRNIGGALAQRKLTRAIVSCLKIGGTPYEWLQADTGRWVPATRDNDADFEVFVRGIAWQTENRNRTLLFNLKVPLVENNVESNVDLCLFDRNQKDFADRDSARAIRASPSFYVALGELKGGIDPAGADEHWKTARSALNRIRDSFSKAGHTPDLFFIGAAIEVRMAIEIWDELVGGRLANAANLTEDDQIASISRWLCGL